MTQQSPQQPEDLEDDNLIDSGMSGDELHPELLPVLTSGRYQLVASWSYLKFRKNRAGYSRSLWMAFRYVLLPAPSHMIDGAKHSAMMAFGGTFGLLASSLALTLAPLMFLGRAAKILALLFAGVCGYVDLAPTKEGVAQMLNKALAQHPRFGALKAAGHKVTLKASDIPDELIARLDQTQNHMH